MKKKRVRKRRRKRNEETIAIVNFVKILSKFDASTSSAIGIRMMEGARLSVLGLAVCVTGFKRVESTVPLICVICFYSKVNILSLVDK